ncbi:PREDICTED: protein FAR1-RELATED SEQUENCE 7-like [Ipomoea nil]|uniref:protein FAR1-RELATED SEQUENCE 7-like n=1 Tax=Ipomoea nil TaxID=35883 RepID=UPI0009009D6D|nr:PREDICTED: protein FAR1-RELATED SEQUENCE 7-like [Ipomoea nil]
MEDGTEQTNSAVDDWHSIQVSEGIVDGSMSSDQVDVDVDGSSSIPVDQDLAGLVVSNADEAFEVYNSYAYRLGFSVRKGHQRYKGSSNTIQMKKFCCSKAGYKANSGVKAYSKIDTRTGCGAFVQFDVGDDGLWTVTKHEKVHNHELCVFNKSHLLRSHRSVGDNQLLYLQGLKDSGVALADGIRFLKHQSGGSPLVGFTSRDAYNSMAADTVKRLDGTDSNSLIEIFRRRQSTETDFFFDFELDLDARLCSFFWRDGQMRRDYEVFGDLLVHDTTYRTNKYDMICAPFVGMNHHCMNVMFGCGFLMSERIESFVWLFKVFSRSMGDKSPQTIMTDQCAAMAAAISKVFPTSRHRLCIWHIGENSKKHIKTLRSNKDFLDMFNYVLKYTETEAEFQFYWTRLVTDYKCHKNTWLEKLYDCREKWCPAFNKDYFSGGILSSQRSETTNHSISRRLSKTAGLCDFYSSFVSVISEWRSKENGEDFRCAQGVPAMMMEHVKLLSHAREVYTIEIYFLFEEQFMKGSACHQEMVLNDGHQQKYHVWRPDIDIIRHEVSFNAANLDISCSCKLMSELGILCCHCIRILHVHCVSSIPDKYILKRWTKKVIDGRNVNIDSMVYNVGVPPSIWVFDISRKFQRLVVSSQDSSVARKLCDEAVDDVKKKVEAEVGHVHIEECGVSSSSGGVQNPSSRRLKGERNKRRSGVIEKKYSLARGRRSAANKAALSTKGAVQSLVLENISKLAGDGYLVHPSSSSSDFVQFSKGLDDNVGVD